MAGFQHTNPLAVPTTVDTVALSTSLADYAKTLTDNASIS